MSTIITPTDTITVTIDNMHKPPVVSVNMSRALPAEYVAGMLAIVIQQLCLQLNQQLSGRFPANLPGSEPAKSGEGAANPSVVPFQKGDGHAT